MNKKYVVNAIQLALMVSITQQTYAQVESVDKVEADLAVTVFDTISVYADSYRTTGTKTNLDPIDAPMSYTRMDQQLLQERQADSVNTALRYEPSVTSESRGTVTLFDEYNIRGFKTYSNFYDGMRLPYDGYWNLMPQVDIYATEAVEVVKGPASSLYGYAAPGGMINQIAKTPRSEDSHEIKVKLGNQNLKQIATDNTGALTDTINYRLVALAREKDGQMQTTEEQRLMVNPSLEWQANDDVTVLASLFYQDDPHMLPSTPLHSIGTVYDASYGKLDSDAYAGDEWNNYSKQVLMPTVTTNWKISDNMQFKNVLRYTDAEAEQRNIYNRGLYGTTDNILIRSAYTTDEQMSNFTTDNQLSYQLDVNDVSHNLLFGIEYQTTDSKATYRDAGVTNTPQLDMGNPNFKQVTSNSLPLNTYVQNDDIKQKQLGIYLQDEVQWQDLTVVAGLRHDDFTSDNHQIKASQGTVYSNSTISNDAKETSGRIAAIYDLVNGVSPYISYSQSFQPTVGSYYANNKPFEPTTADQLEAGLKYFSASSGTEANIALFDITKENVVVSNPNNYLEQSQTGEIVSKGVEVSGKQTVNEWMDISASYSYTNAEITEDLVNPQFVGNTPQQVAEQKATLWADFYPTSDIKLNAGLRYQSGMQIDRQNSDELPSVTVMDIGGSYRFNDIWSVDASVSNLFDKTYVGTCYDRENCWMGPERQMSLSITAKF